MTQPAHHHTPADTDTGGPELAEQGRNVLAELAARAIEDRPHWHARALCAQTDPEAFFPEQGGSTREAREICQRCEVRSESLEAALGHDERFGVWGGLSERERRRLKPCSTDMAAAKPAAAARREMETLEQVRRESAPAPGPGRHVGGAGLATTLPTEPRHPRGRPVQARRSTFPARVRATQPANTEVTPTAASRPAPPRAGAARTRRSRPSPPPPALARAEQPSTNSDADKNTATVTALRPAGPDPHRAGEHPEPAEDQAAAPPARRSPPTTPR